MYQINKYNWKHVCHMLSQPKYAIIIINIICWNIFQGSCCGVVAHHDNLYRDGHRQLGLESVI